jgi:hypothetical protein
MGHFFGQKKSYLVVEIPIRNLKFSKKNILSHICIYDRKWDKIWGIKITFGG